MYRGFRTLLAGNLCIFLAALCDTLPLTRGSYRNLLLQAFSLACIGDICFAAVIIRGATPFRVIAVIAVLASFVIFGDVIRRLLPIIAPG